MSSVYFFKALCNMDNLDRMPIKTICFVLAIINAIINGLILIWCCLGWLLVLMFSDFSFNFGGGGRRFKRDLAEDIDDYWIPSEYFLPLCTVFSLLNLIFAILLCVGIGKRRWRLVKTYFIYGCLITVLAFLDSIVQLCVGQRWEFALWELFGCVLHSMFLVLVHQTHVKILRDAMFTDHVRLNDIEDRHAVYP